MELYIGVDVSKTKLNIYINNVNKMEYEFENSVFDIRSFTEFLRKLQLKNHVIQLVIYEATGG